MSIAQYGNHKDFANTVTTRSSWKRIAENRVDYVKIVSSIQYYLDVASFM